MLSLIKTQMDLKSHRLVVDAIEFITVILLSMSSFGFVCLKAIKLSVANLSSIHSSVSTAVTLGLGD